MELTQTHNFKKVKILDVDPDSEAQNTAFCNIKFEYVFDFSIMVSLTI